VMSTIQIPVETLVGPFPDPGRSITAGASAPRASWIDIATKTTTKIRFIRSLPGIGQILFENPFNFSNCIRIKLGAVI